MPHPVPLMLTQAGTLEVVTCLPGPPIHAEISVNSDQLVLKFSSNSWIFQL